MHFVIQLFPEHPSYRHALAVLPLSGHTNSFKLQSPSLKYNTTHIQIIATQSPQPPSLLLKGNY